MNWTSEFARHAKKKKSKKNNANNKENADQTRRIKANEITKRISNCETTKTSVENVEIEVQTDGK